MTRPRVTGVAAVAVPDWRASPPNEARLVAVSFWIIDGRPYLYDLDGWVELGLPPGFTPPVTPGATVVKPRRRVRR